MLRVVISFAGEILEQFIEHDLDDALWLRDYYVQAGFNATITRA